MCYYRQNFLLFFVVVTSLFSSTSLVLAQAERPAFPTNVKANPVSACALDLSWDQVDPGAFSHVYFWSLDNFNASNERVDLPAPNKNYPNTPPAKTGSFSERITKLVPGQKYYYKVQACSPGTCSDLKSANNGFPAQLPGLPNKPAVSEIVSIVSTPTANGLQDVKVSWREVAGLSDFGGYALYMSKNGGPYEYITYRPVAKLKANGEVDFKLGSIALFHSENALPTNADLSFYVRSYDSSFGCVGSNEDPVAAKAQLIFSDASQIASLPQRPQITKGETLSKNPPKVQITFNDFSLVETRYEVLRTIDGESSLYTLPINAGEFIDANVLANKTYTYQVRACFESIGCSIYSEPRLVALGIERPLLTSRIIYSERNEASTLSVIQLSWTPVAGAQGYNVLRRELPDGVFKPILTTQKTSFRDSVPMAHYEYTVEAEKGVEKATSEPRVVFASSSFILRGHGWAGLKDQSQSSPVGLGWLSFNSESKNLSYSVQADKDGLFSGLVWTRYGWLSFNTEDLKNCPQAPCEARVLTDGRFTGWARFLARKEDPSSGAWVGWLKLSGVAQNNKSYGLQYVRSSTSSDYKKVIGAAWGGDVIGYVVLGGAACLYCNVTADDALNPGSGRPVVSNVQVLVTPINDAWCGLDPAYTVSWNYIGSPDQIGATISFFNLADGSLAFSDAVTFDKSYRLSGPLSKLTPGARYRVSVVASNGDGVSDPAYSIAFTVPERLSPLVKFRVDPELPRVNELVTFYDESIDRSSSTYPIRSWDWRFTFAQPERSSEKNPEVVFSSFPANVELTITDSGGMKCSGVLELDGSASSTGVLKRRQLFER